MAIMLMAPYHRRNVTPELTTRDLSVRDRAPVGRKLQEAMDISGVVQRPKLKGDMTTALAKGQGLGDLPLDFRHHQDLLMLDHILRMVQCTSVKALLWAIHLILNMEFPATR
ncbi:hypothetical protein BG000_010328 [Podila horticola]|nr:hypothetical protein BG000_010328 [Podila horticola]